MHLVCVCIIVLCLIPYVCSSTRKISFFLIPLSCLLRHFSTSTHFQSSLICFYCFSSVLPIIFCCCWSLIFPFTLTHSSQIVRSLSSIWCFSIHLVFFIQIQPAILTDSLHWFSICSLLMLVHGFFGYFSQYTRPVGDCCLWSIWIFRLPLSIYYTCFSPISLVVCLLAWLHGHSGNAGNVFVPHFNEMYQGIYGFNISCRIRVSFLRFCIFHSLPAFEQ